MVHRIVCAPIFVIEFANHFESLHHMIINKYHPYAHADKLQGVLGFTPRKEKPNKKI
jgi:hypothetical protein